MENLVVVPVILRTDLSGSLHFQLQEMSQQQVSCWTASDSNYLEVINLS
jgi:hypothetical protein